MLHAITTTPRPILPFTVTLRSPGRTLRFTALARSSGEALGNALALHGLPLPMAASVRPDTAAAMRAYRRKLALADLVEGV